MRWASRFLWFFSALALHCHGFSAILEDERTALLRFRERVELDPYGALKQWKEDGVADPCSWIGVGCSDSSVVSLDLKDLCLKGTLAPELPKLVHLKQLILYNNSFYGTVPGEIAKLKNLEVLDLGHNNLSGHIPPEIPTIVTLKTLILDGNNFTYITYHESHVEKDLSSSSLIRRYLRNATKRKLMLLGNIEDSILDIFKRSEQEASSFHELRPASSPSPSPSPVSSPSPTLISHTRESKPESHSQAPEPALSPSTLPASSPHIPEHEPSIPNDINLPPPSAAGAHADPVWMVYASVAGGASSLIALSAFCCLCNKGNKVVTVRPLASRPSAGVQKPPPAAGAGVLMLRRMELEAACEGFSNVIGTISGYTLYKGTLSSGVEIAVTSSVAATEEGWPKQMDNQFKKKVSVLSQVSHKNFMNLLGYCEDEKPFTRMMVLEYATNGTLFEHLHIKEAEHLDWDSRLRIIMGVAYCIEHLHHQLKEPLILTNLTSSTIYLTDDFTAKVAELPFFLHNDDPPTLNSSPPATDLANPDASIDVPPPPPDQRTVIYKFGVVCLEILSGRRPFSEDYGLLVRWASSHLSGKRPLKDMVDPTLVSFREEQVAPLCDVIRSCVADNPRKRATMAEVVARLRAVTSITSEAASPKNSPLLWAELQLLSMEAN